jgi:hypothetical protein
MGNVQKYIQSPAVTNPFPTIPTRQNDNLAMQIGKGIANIPSGIGNSIIGKGIIAPTIDFGTNLGKLATGQQKTPYNELLSPVTRLGYQIGGGYQPTDNVDRLKQTFGNLAGIVEPIASAYLPKGVENLATKPTLWQSILEGAKTGTKFGAGFGAIQGLSENRDTTDNGKYLLSVLGMTVGGAGMGAAFGGAAGGISGFIKQRTELTPEVRAQLRTADGRWAPGDKLVKPANMTPKAWDFQLRFNKQYGRSPYKTVRSSDVTAAAKYEAEKRVGLQVRDVNKDKNPLGVEAKTLSPSTPKIGKIKVVEQNKIAQQVDPMDIGNAELVAGKKVKLVQSQSPLIDDTLKQRGFAKSVAENKKTPEELAAELEKIRYSPLSNKETLTFADKLIKKSETEALSFAKSNTDTNANATALRLIEKYINEGKFTEANQLTKEVSPRFTKAGQEIQILSAYGRLTPTGAIKYAQNLINEANKANPRLKLELTPENTKVITEAAKKIKGLPEGSRERTVAIAELMKNITDIMPVSIGQKIATIQTMMQLLNPKTAIRNIVGNTIFTGMENISDVVGSALDKGVSMFTGNRTKVLPSLKAQGQGFMKGLNEGMEDVSKGINTAGIGTQFDIPTRTFTKGILSKLETALNIELRVPDRAAYTSAFEGSLNNQMRAAGITKPTEEMIQIAHADGLYRTFQDNSKLAEIFSGTKKLLNKVGTPDGKFGLGDFILKYPKTPANILSRGLDYSPIGFAKGIYEGVRPLLTGQPFNQKAFVETLSRAMTGSGLVAAGYVLAKNGIITGKPAKDYDINQVQSTTGQGAFKINIDALKRFFNTGGQPQDARNGDVLVSYDWAQPTALSIAMGANQATGGKVTDAINSAVDSYQSAVDTITGQPMVKGLIDFTSDIKNKGVVGAGTNAVLNSVSGFVPSLSRQAANVGDTTQRTSYDPNPLKETYNKTIMSIPGMRNTLEPKLNVFGQEQPNYPGGVMKRLFDIFINPAFVSVVNENPTAKEVLDIYQRSGETQQAPRIAPQSISINGQKIPVTAKQYTEYQRYIGTKTNDMFNNIVTDPVFQKATDEDKAKFMGNVLSDINSAAKIDLFGNTPKTVSDNVKRISGSSNLGGVGITTDGNLKLTGGDLLKPKLTGNSIVDKKLMSAYNSDITQQQKDQIELYNGGYITAEELTKKINELETKRVKSASTKKISFKKATIKAIPKLKATKLKVKKLKALAFKAPKFKATKVGKISKPKLAKVNSLKSLKAKV